MAHQYFQRERDKNTANITFPTRRQLTGIHDCFSTPEYKLLIMYGGILFENLSLMSLLLRKGIAINNNAYNGIQFGLWLLYHSRCLVFPSQILYFTEPLQYIHRISVQSVLIFLVSKL